MHISRREFIVVTATGAGSLACTPSTGGSAGGSQPGNRASTELSVLVSGLVGLAFRKEAAHLLLLDGEKTDTGLHVARFSVRVGSVAPASAPPSGTQDGKPFWNLANHQLTLVSGVTTGPTRAGGRDPKKEVEIPYSPASHKDATWLARMSKIPGVGSGSVNPLCLADDPSPAKVASRVSFNGGEVAARFKPPFHQIVFEFGPTGSPNLFRQALGELSVSQTISSDTVVFRLQRFDRSGNPQDIVLTPTSGGELEVAVENKPSPEPPCDKHETGNVLTHFLAFYQLLAEPPATPLPPTCRAKNCRGCPSSTEVVYCPPADYDGP
jgi:hypothetical protein